MIEVLPTMPSTFSLWMSFLASDAAWPGSVCSVSIEYWIGRPLIPPLSLTQSKYAFAVFGMSVKSVPGCFVAIAPSLIGAPLAFLPLPRPHFDAAALSPPLGDELWRKGVGDRQPERRPGGRPDGVAAGQVGVLERRAERHGRERRRDALDGRVEVVEGGEPDLGGDLRAEA